jgi:hypothetical protein
MLYGNSALLGNTAAGAGMLAALGNAVKNFGGRASSLASVGAITTGAWHCTGG